MDKTKQNPPWFKRKLDFISPHELEKCVSLIERVAGYEGNDWRLDKPSTYELVVKVAPTDDDTYRFFAEFRYKGLVQLLLPLSLVCSKGYLKRWDRKSTHVFGYIEFPWLNYVLSTIILAALTAIALSIVIRGDYVVRGLLAAVFCLVLLILHWRALNMLWHKLPDMLVTSLHPMPESLGFHRINLKLGQPKRPHRS
jgi:hypothetical protein